MTELLEAISGATSQAQLLRQNIAQRAADAHARKRSFLLEKCRKARDSLRRREKRLGKVLAGMKAIQNLALMPETQDLLEVRGQVSLVSMKDSFSDSRLALTQDGIEIVSLQYGIQWGNNESIIGRAGLDEITSYRLLISYEVDDDLILAKKIASIFSMRRLVLHVEEDADEDYLQEVRSERADASDEDVFTQLLADCADPENLARYMLQTLH